MEIFLIFLSVFVLVVEFALAIMLFRMIGKANNRVKALELELAKIEDERAEQSSRLLEIEQQMRATSKDTPPEAILPLIGGLLSSPRTGIAPAAVMIAYRLIAAYFGKKKESSRLPVKTT